MSKADTAIVLCAGKDCRRRDEFVELRRALSGRCSVTEVGCIGVCAGPVLVVERERNQSVVLAKLRTSKDVRDVKRMVVDGAAPSKRLRHREVVGSRAESAVQKSRKRLAKAS